MFRSFLCQIFLKTMRYKPVSWVQLAISINSFSFMPLLFSTKKKISSSLPYFMFGLLCEEFASALIHKCCSSTLVIRHTSLIARGICIYFVSIVVLWNVFTQLYENYICLHRLGLCFFPVIKAKNKKENLAFFCLALFLLRGNLHLLFLTYQTCTSD